MGEMTEDSSLPTPTTPQSSAEAELVRHSLAAWQSSCRDVGRF